MKVVVPLGLSGEGGGEVVGEVARDPDREDQGDAAPERAVQVRLRPDVVLKEGPGEKIV